MRSSLAALSGALLFLSLPVLASELADSIEADYDEHLGALWEHFHSNPELSLVEFETAKRMAVELRAAGFDVTEGVGGTGVVAIMENGAGPHVMMRADMDGLPIEEKSGLPSASRAKQVDPITGNEVFVMHACGHDVHITSLVGTARHMAARRDDWGGTLMLLVQPAEERVMGARAMLADGLWERFGKPDYVLGFHVTSGLPTGTINALEGASNAGSDSVDIIVHGVGAHGASPHLGKDPIVIASQIVVALQTLVSRELPPRQPGVVTVGSFHSGSKHNIISDRAHLQLTVRNTSEETRKLLLEGIERIAVNVGRAAGLAEDKLPEVKVSGRGVPPNINDVSLTRRLTRAWTAALGNDAVTAEPPSGMSAEDFGLFAESADIPSMYWSVGGTPQAAFDAANAGGPRVPSHHSPLFKISAEPSVRTGVESTIVALMELMGDQ